MLLLRTVRSRTCCFGHTSIEWYNRRPQNSSRVATAHEDHNFDMSIFFSPSMLLCTTQEQNVPLWHTSVEDCLRVVSQNSPCVPPEVQQQNVNPLCTTLDTFGIGGTHISNPVHCTLLSMAPQLTSSFQVSRGGGIQWLPLPVDPG